MPRTRSIAIACATFFVFLATQALAQLPVPFTADMSFKSREGETMNGKYYVGNQRMRMDMDAHGHEISMIIDPATKTSYSVMHQQRMYMEFHTGQNMMQRGPKMPDLHAYDPDHPCANDPDVTCEKAGSETVNGRSTDKWLFKNKDGITTTAWVDKKLHFPIKTVTSDGAEVNLTNVQEGAPPASTFEVPAGYHKLDMGSMMGGHPPQQ